MQTLSSTCLAIALADKAGSLRLTEEQGRFGSFVAISDNAGLIEVALSWDEANARLAELRERAA